MNAAPSTSSPMPSFTWFEVVLTRFFRPENYVPLTLAYGWSMVAFGVIMLVEHDLASMALYANFDDHLAWGIGTTAMGLATLGAMAWKRGWLWVTCALSFFVWGWIDLAFLFSFGLSTAQAMYTPAAMASAWLAIRTAPLRS